MIDFLGTYLPEFFYVLCGLVSFDTAYRATKNKEARIGTSLFWFLLGVIFTFGKVSTCWCWSTINFNGLFNSFKTS